MLGVQNEVVLSKTAADGFLAVVQGQANLGPIVSDGSLAADEREPESEAGECTILNSSSEAVLGLSGCDANGEELHGSADVPSVAAGNTEDDIRSSVGLAVKNLSPPNAKQDAGASSYPLITVGSGS